MTQIEFLESRIADDEALAHKVVTARGSDIARGLYTSEMVEQQLALWESDGNFGQPAIYADPDRVLAECQAKRQIIAELRLFEEAKNRPGSDARVFQIWAELARVVSFLTLPYADHADFDPAWTI